MGVVWTVLVLLAFATAFDGAFRRGADDASWEARWRFLDLAGRAGIVTAAHSCEARAELTAPEDRQLLAGYQRRQRRRRGYVELGVSVFLLVVAAFVVAGVVSSGVLGVIFGASFAVTWAWGYLDERRMDGTLRAVADALADTGS